MNLLYHLFTPKTRIYGNLKNIKTFYNKKIIQIWIVFILFFGQKCDQTIKKCHILYFVINLQFLITIYKIGPLKWCRWRAALKNLPQLASFSVTSESACTNWTALGDDLKNNN